MIDRLRHLRYGLLIVVYCLWRVGSAQAAQADNLPPTQVVYTYGGQIHFTLVVPEGAAPNNAEVRFRQTDGSTQAIVAAVNIEPAGYTLQAERSLDNLPITPFATVEFWWALTFSGANETETPIETFEYVDNRFEWQVVSNQPAVRVYWYDGNQRFGQTAADVAQQAYGRIASALNLPETPAEPVDVYIYASGNDLLSGLRLVGRDWAGGHADPDLNVIMVAVPNLPPSQAQIEFGRFLPHELSHVLVYRFAGAEGYDTVPRWLDEGLAVFHEDQPNATYIEVLKTAADDGILFPLESLCGSFPLDSSEAFRAYAQSDSLVRHIINTRGRSAILEMLTLYSSGVGCEIGTQEALGLSLAELEAEWKQAEFGITPTTSALPDYAPFAVLAIVLLLPAWLMFRRPTARHAPPRKGTPRRRSRAL